MDAETAANRAVLCTGCPQNEKGDLMSFFTRPVSEAIRRAYNLRAHWKLETALDPELGVCRACGCPLKLKVHMPLPKILEHIPPESKAALDARCWILKGAQ